MSQKDKNTINRRGFVKNGTTALLGTAFLSFGVKEIAATPKVEEVMKAAVSNVKAINNYLNKLAAATEALKKTEVPKEHLGKNECTEILSIIDAVVAVVIAIVVAKIAAIISATTKINYSLNSLAEWETEIKKQNKLTIEIRDAIKKFREITENVKDVVAARDIFLHLSQDRTHADKLLEALRTKNRSAIEEMLKRDVPGSNVEVREVKEDNEFLMNVRVGKLIHCFSTSSECSGKSLTVTK